MLELILVLCTFSGFCYVVKTKKNNMVPINKFRINFHSRVSGTNLILNNFGSV